MIAPAANPTDLGQAMHALATELFPICRSVTGPGVRETLSRLQRLIPVEIHEVPTGTQVFDWTVPKEWSIQDAWIQDDRGRRVVDFRESNLHVVNGSVPVETTLRWNELRPRLYSLPDHPDWIPYRTCFHTEDWGFCLTDRQLRHLESLGNRSYSVRIDSTLRDGSLTYGELYLPGETAQEILISTHVCHPSLANDNLSGIAVATYLAASLRERTRRYSYRFLFIPATIGAITWLSLNQDSVRHIHSGWILSVVGDAGGFTYKKSRRGEAPVDRAFEHVLRHANGPFTIQEFEPFGYDQRQFCSPGFDLPVGCLMRSPNGCFPEYHTSADNLEFLRADSLAGSLDVCLAVVDVLEFNRRVRNLNPCCEPRLGPRGLYHAFGKHAEGQALQRAVLWVLNQADGKQTLLEIAERSGIRFELIREAADLLAQHQLLEETSLDTSSNLKRNDLGRPRHEHCVL